MLGMISTTELPDNHKARSIWPPVFFHMFVNALSLAVLAG